MVCGSRKKLIINIDLFFQKKWMDLLENLTILHLDNQSNIEEKLYPKADISKIIGCYVMLKYLSLKMEFLMRKL